MDEHRGGYSVAPLRISQRYYNRLRLLKKELDSHRKDPLTLCAKQQKAQRWMKTDMI